LKPGTLSNVPCFVLILIALLNDLSEKAKAIYYLVVFCHFIFSVHLFIGTNNLTSFDFKVIGFVTLSVGSYYSGLGRIILTFEEKTTK
jgi:hypothetical protein